MKAVLMAFSPKECEKIFSGEKLVDVRKIAPKLETPSRHMRIKRRTEAAKNSQRLLGQLLLRLQRVGLITARRYEVNYAKNTFPKMG